MAITPAEARKLRSENYPKDVFDDQVKRIDTHLSTTEPAADGKWRYTVNASLSSALVRALEAAYRKAGWNVHLGTSDRDGHCLVFADVPLGNGLKD